MASTVRFDWGFHCLMVQQLVTGVALGEDMEWMTMCEWFSQLALFSPQDLFLLLSNLYTQHGARTPNPEIKSHRLY